jgi:hypothetical protein
MPACNRSRPVATRRDLSLTIFRDLELSGQHLGARQLLQTFRERVVIGVALGNHHAGHLLGNQAEGGQADLEGVLSGGVNAPQSIRVTGSARMT